METYEFETDIQGANCWISFNEDKWMSPINIEVKIYDPIPGEDVIYDINKMPESFKNEVISHIEWYQDHFRRMSKQNSFNDAADMERG